LEEVPTKDEAGALPLMYEHHQSQWSEAVMKIAGGDYGFDNGEVDANKHELRTITEKDYTYLMIVLTMTGGLAAANTLAIGVNAASNTRRRLRQRKEKERSPKP
jgi:hypothetical protein